MEADQMKKVTAITFSLVLSALTTACVTQPTIYSWGQYENIVYDTYNSPGKSAPEREIEQMEQDYQKARAQNKPVPPGFHAHLGYLYYQVGKADAAREQFQAEKAQFPESAVLMDRLSARLGK